MPGDRERLPPARMRVGDRAVGDLEDRREVERRLGRDLAVLERTGDGERLERRARLVGRARRAVRHRVVRRLVEPVGVDARPVREREDRAVVGVHDQRGGALGLPVLADLVEDLLGVVLDVRVERQPDLLAGHGALDLAQLDRVAERVADQLPLAVLAAQLPVELVLEPRQAVALGADVAEQLRRHPVARVVAAVLGDELEPVDAEALGALRAAGGHAVRDVDEAGVAAGELLQQRVLRLAQHLRELRGRGGGVLDQVRGRGDRLRRLRDRELGAVDVGDRAAPGGDDDVGLLLGRGRALERVGLDDAEPAGAGAGEQDHAEEDREEQADAAFDQPHGYPCAATTPPPAGAEVVVGGVTVGAGRGDRGGRRRGRRDRRDRRRGRSSASASSPARPRPAGAIIEPGSIPLFASSAAAASDGGCIRETARSASFGPALQVADVAGGRHQHPERLGADLDPVGRGELA